MRTTRHMAAGVLPSVARHGVGDGLRPELKAALDKFVTENKTRHGVRNEES